MAKPVKSYYNFHEEQRRKSRGNPNHHAHHTVTAEVYLSLVRCPNRWHNYGGLTVTTAVVLPSDVTELPPCPTTFMADLNAGGGQLRVFNHTVQGNAYFRDSQLQRLGTTAAFMGDLDISYTRLEVLNTIAGGLNIVGTPIKLIGPKTACHVVIVDVGQLGILPLFTERPRRIEVDYTSKTLSQGNVIALNLALKSLQPARPAESFTQTVLDYWDLTTKPKVSLLPNYQRYIAIPEIFEQSFERRHHEILYRDFLQPHLQELAKAKLQAASANHSRDRTP